MSPERSEEFFQPVLRLDYDIKAPGFFSYVRWAVRGKSANFESLVASKVFDEASRIALMNDARTVSESFERSVSSAEGIADKKKQSDVLSSAVAEFNKSMKSLEVRLGREVRSQASGKPSVPMTPFKDDDLNLRSADASRFLEESGI